MRIGLPKEIKQSEYRVSLTPAHVELLVADGHEVYVETSAGEGSGFTDAAYGESGARVVGTHEELFRRAELVVKVKEPIDTEHRLIRPEQVVFGYFHFAASRELTQAMLKRGCACVASETIRKRDGTLPTLRPMSEVAGKMAIHEGAKCLERPGGGFGILLGGIPGVPPAEVVVLGGGTAGAAAAQTAAGLGARVTLFEINEDRLRRLAEIMPANVTVLSSNPKAIRERVRLADLVVGAVLVAGARAPILVNRRLLKEMKRGAVVVDIAVDQGGCVETIRPTTHDNPTYVVDGVIHYGVANMPGALPRTSTYGYANAMIAYVRKLAARGLRQAVHEDEELRLGLNLVGGKITCPGVAEYFKLPYVEPCQAVELWARQHGAAGGVSEPRGRGGAGGAKGGKGKTADYSGQSQLPPPSHSPVSASTRFTDSPSSLPDEPCGPGSGIGVKPRR